MTPEQQHRYARQIRLSDVGTAGQEKLLNARALIVGLGGLGSPAAMYLAASGVGTIVLSDFDRVETSNLQRQIIHRELDIGEPKATSAKRSLRDINAACEIIALDWENAGYGCPALDLAQSPDLESLPHLAASPDLDSYHSTVRRRWKMLDTGSLARVADAGTIFRCIDALVWELDRLVADGYLPRCLPRMAIFSTVLGGSMKVMGWCT